MDDQCQGVSSKVSSTASRTDMVENEAKRREMMMARETTATEVKYDERGDINKLAEDFINNFRNRLKFQQQEKSLKHQTQRERMAPRNY
ncbi:hypothetical protein LOK49_LG15G02593 [Camellia lanceoleosa]|uniref:Uncharacterized protein n=1 Tax=Camellia lanceoleosa TaxID=1840588 RepID=A0ACC0F6I3_9ERIC|nr:hypothetical protein LOK49_LG15G02593 [Camellia lanceoleosa]